LRWSAKLSLAFGLGLASISVAQQPPPAGARQSLTLAEAYSLALTRSETVLVAETNVADAKSRHLGAWSQIGPRVQGIGTALFQQEQRDTQSPMMPQPLVTPPEQVIVGGTLTQPLFRRQVFPARAAGALGVESNQASLARTREQLMMDVSTSFIGVLRSRQQIHLAENAVHRAEAQLQSATTRVKVGAGLKTAELLAQIDVSRARVQLVNAEGEERNQEIGFERLMGLPPPATLVLPSTPAIPPVDQLQGQSNRNDLRATRFLKLQSRATEDLWKGKIFWPTLDLQGTLFYSNPVGVFTPNALVWTASAVLTIPLFQTGDEWVQLRLQKIHSDAVSLQERLLQKQVTEDVRRAANHVETATRAVTLSEQQVQIAQQNYTLVVNQFKLGATSFLEVANAQSALTEAENLRLVSGYERELAVYQLLFANGTLKL
jgi:outer membrane protein TolC